MQMPTDAATAIAYVGACVALVGGGVALFNARKAVCWKRAELANTYMKDFNNNPELVFAGRCLDWQGGKLIVPDSLRAYLPDGTKVIEHDRTLYAAAVSPFLQIGDMDGPAGEIRRAGSAFRVLRRPAPRASRVGRSLFPRRRGVTIPHARKKFVKPRTAIFVLISTQSSCKMRTYFQCWLRIMDLPALLPRFRPQECSRLL